MILVFHLSQLKKSALRILSQWLYQFYRCFLFTLFAILIPINLLSQETSASQGVHSIDLELFKLIGNTVQLNYAYEFVSGNAIVIGPRYTGISSNAITGTGWGMELQYYFGNKNRMKAKTGTRDFDTYFRRSFKRYFGIFTTYDKWQKEDYLDYPPYRLAEISMNSLSLGGIVDFRFLPAACVCIDFYIGFGYRYSNIANNDYYYGEYTGFLDHLFRPGYTGLIVKAGLRTGIIFQ